MISLFIMYSTDRQKQLEYTVKSLQRMELYDQCQKTLVVDHNLVTFVPDGYEVVQVPRVNKEFCWSYMWDAGVETARYPIVLYLDSDRLLPPAFLRMVVDSVKEDSFVFTSQHFMLREWLPWDQCQEFLELTDIASRIIDPPYMGKLIFEPRFGNPTHTPGKNVMSGSTAFLKKTFRKVGGVDPWYRGHGAFADTDFHMTATAAGCEFIDLNVPELHCPHPKSEGKKELDSFTLKRLGLDNYIYYCKKWGVPMVYAETLASEIGVPKPVAYVAGKLKQYKEQHVQQSVQE